MDQEEQDEQMKKVLMRKMLNVWKAKKDRQEQLDQQAQQVQQVEPQQLPVEQQQAAEDEPAPKSQVFSREEYAQPQFWEDRYKEHKGTFDWYVEWPQLQYYLEESEFKVEKDCKILMIGCGNSKLSEQMYKAGYKHITSIDISQTIIERMQQRAQTNQMDLTYLVMDATAMSFEDKQFDLAIDKGTLDALACSNEDISLRLLSEMGRVAKQSTIISNSTWLKRKFIIGEIFDGRTILETQVLLSGQSELINIIRTQLKDKPISHVLKDKQALIECLSEYQQQAKILKDQPRAATTSAIITRSEQVIQQEQGAGIQYDPRRQSHCFIYKIV